ncbi:MAG: response regulator transcription factor [Verrucomicrobiota bacterium]|jgi:DNA-binding NarL/FixJ family response regulator
MISVSIIEDDPSVRTILEGWVSDARGFRCAGVHANAAHALVRIPVEKPEVVLVDINLPDQSGIECVWQLKPLLPMTQFLMLTMYEDAEHIFKALESGATGYLLKRNSREEVLAAVRQVHEGGSPMPSFIARKVVSFFQRVRQPRQQDLQGLSPRENEILQLLVRGYSYKEIADLLGISIPTVNTYIHRTYEKLHVHSRGQAVARYSRMTEPPSSPSAAILE